MALLFVVILSYSIRTGTFVYIPGFTKQHPLNDFEIVVGAYAVCLLAGGMVGVVTAPCEALGAI